MITLVLSDPTSLRAIDMHSVYCAVWCKGHAVTVGKMRTIRTLRVQGKRGSIPLSRLSLAKRAELTKTLLL